MNILPKTRDEWIGLPLFPFKAWVAIAFLFYLFARALVFGQYARHGTGEFSQIVMLGYMVSVPVLLFGALIQSLICDHGAATRTALYAISGIIVLSVYLL
jgi:hypothetical protein